MFNKITWSILVEHQLLVKILAYKKKTTEGISSTSSDIPSIQFPKYGIS